MVIKFPLKMADGAQVRSIEELREHFDLATVLEYYTSGRLLDWLSSRYYDEEADMVSKLDSSSADFKKSLCEALGVPYSEEEASKTNMDDISRRNERREMLKKYTADDAVLAAADRVAFTQDELMELLNKGEKEICLCGDEYIISVEFENVTYIGVNNPKIEISGDISNKNIVFKNIDMQIKTLEDVLDLENLDLENYDPKGLNPETIHVIKTEAEKGNPIAQYIYGRYCYFGRGSVINKKEAVKWYAKAAKQNLPAAQEELGQCYHYEKGVENDETKASEWHRAAIGNYRNLAEKGDAKAQYELGRCLSDCNYDDYDDNDGYDEEAVKWFRKSSEQGHLNAMICLVSFNERGFTKLVNNQESEKWCQKIEEIAEQGGVDFICDVAASCDELTAREERIKLYRKAANQGYIKAMIKLCHVCKNAVYDLFSKHNDDYYEQEGRKWKNKIIETAEQRGIDSLIETASILEEEYLHEEAMKLYKKAAERGDVSAQYKLADCYYYHYGVKWDDEEGIKRCRETAVKWYTKAAEQGGADAQFSLACCYFDGDGVEEDKKEAIKWYSNSAKQNNAKAMRMLANCYFDGEGVEQNNYEAVKWLKKSAEQGSIDAMLQLSECYFDGEVVEKDFDEAVMWLRKVAEQDDANAKSYAMLELVERYEYGKGVETNKQEAQKWCNKLEKIAEQEDAHILTRLGTLYYEKGDYNSAVKWFEKVVELDEEEAQYYLGLCYFDGKGVEKNIKTAVSLIKQAAKNYNSDASDWLEEHGYELPSD